ncbi:MAG: DUF2911 domain-containing protein [Flavobacteriales bacterium]
MKHLLTAALLAAPLFASAQKLPQPSPTCKLEQMVGLTTIKIEYGAPSMKGRVIFGDVVPYGEVWRTGANKCTTIEFDTPITFGGEMVKPGKYSMFTIPNPDTWIIILNRNTELWGAYDRKEEEDVMKIKLPSKKMSEAQETFRVSIAMGQMDEAEVVLSWEHMKLAIPINADCTEQALRNIDEALAKPDAKYNAYSSSARFCIDRNVRLKDALAWAEKSVSMEKKYWNTHTLALANAANGKYKEAIDAANMSIELAQAEKDANYVKMNREKIKEWSTTMGAKPANNAVRMSK